MPNICLDYKQPTDHFDGCYELNNIGFCLYILYVQGHVMDEGNLLQVQKTTPHIMKGNIQAPPEHHW